MGAISPEHLIQSVADGLQFISYYHSPDFVEAMVAAYEREQSQAAKDAIAQILINSKMAAEGHRPICQDTGIVVVFAKIGMAVRWNTDRSLQDMIDEGVRRAYLDPENPLRASVVNPPWGMRINTRDNTPAVVHTEMVEGDKVDITLAAKGGGSENKAKLTVLNPGQNLVDWIVATVPELGAGWCPPGILGVGIGGSPEKSAVLAKESLMDPIDIQEIMQRGAKTPTEQLRLKLYDAINNLGIGAQGLGGVTTVLDVKVREFPTHAASLPVSIIPNCAATRHVHFTLDGSGPAQFRQPSMDIWPDIVRDNSNSRRVNLDGLSKEETRKWKIGDTLLISGKILTGRDAAHKRMVEIFDRGEKLPADVDLENRFIYYVGPVDAVGDEAVGPAGPTTATRMDMYTDRVIQETGLLGMIGKAERGPEGIRAIKRHGAVYLIAVGGAAFLVSKAIRSARVVAFEDLGMEAIYEFDVVDMPVTVAVDSDGNSVHTAGPKKWRKIISELPVAVA
ncbi:MAG: fumarate hydratase [Acidiferrobacterales bacterium]|nr:fumarate hydratase [Acidiferrobacterales bacterium]